MPANYAGYFHKGFDLYEYLSGINANWNEYEKWDKSMKFKMQMQYLGSLPLGRDRVASHIS